MDTRTGVSATTNGRGGSAPAPWASRRGCRSRFASTRQDIHSARVAPIFRVSRVGLVRTSRSLRSNAKWVRQIRGRALRLVAPVPFVCMLSGRHGELHGRHNPGIRRPWCNWRRPVQVHDERVGTVHGARRTHGLVTELARECSIGRKCSTLHTGF